MTIEWIDHKGRIDPGQGPGSVPERVHPGDDAISGGTIVDSNNVVRVRMPSLWMSGSWPFLSYGPAGAEAANDPEPGPIG